MDNASMIDTAADAGDMDEKINKEYRKRICTIVAQEKMYKNPATKKKLEQDIIDYIKLNSKPVATTITYEQ